MQQRALVILAILAAPVAASSVSASSAATAWLRSHKAPADDELQALAGANPQAFAIVSALLKKHPKGMAQLAPEERGPDVFRRMMGEGSHMAAAAPRVEVPYASEEVAEVSTPVVDQAKYDPNAAANRDESSVQRLLAAVAGMGGNKGKKIAALMAKKHNKQEADNALTADESLFEAPAPVKAFQEPEAPVVAAPVKRENSYLKGIDLSGDMPVAEGRQEKQVDSSADSLASFSFDDAAAQEVAKPKPKPVVVAAKPKKDNSNAFMKFLGYVKEAPNPEEKPVEAAPVAEKKSNSYLDTVKFFG